MPTLDCKYGYAAASAALDGHVLRMSALSLIGLLRKPGTGGPNGSLMTFTVRATRSAVVNRPPQDR
jgi:hypothetical protein